MVLDRPIPTNHPTRNVEQSTLNVFMMGYGCLAYHILSGLLNHPNVQVIGVFPWTKKPKSDVKPDAFEKKFQTLIKQHKIKEYIFKSANSYEFIATIETLKPDVVFIGSWGEILKEHVLEKGPIYLNCHPSKLPDHRGSNPYASAICMGEKETAVTFHKIDVGIDTGPILKQTIVKIDPEETGETLRNKCGLLAETMISDLVNMLCVPDTLNWQPQDPEKGRYFPKLEVKNGIINWQNPYTPLQIRGLHPWLAGLTFVDLPLKQYILVATSKVTLVQNNILKPYKKQLKHLPNKIFPGMILVYDGGVLYLASPDPRFIWQVEEIKLFFYWTFLPKWLSKWFGYLIFTPGKLCHS